MRTDFRIQINLSRHINTGLVPLDDKKNAVSKRDSILL
jgi:hypothetical protein